MIKKNLIKTSLITLTLATILCMSACGKNGKKSNETANNDNNTSIEATTSVNIDSNKNTEKSSENITEVSTNVDVSLNTNAENSAEGDTNNTNDTNNTGSEDNTPAPADNNTNVSDDNNSNTAVDTDDNSGNNNYVEEDNSSDTGSEDNSGAEEVTPEPEPEPEPEPAEPSYIPCINFIFGDDFTNSCKVTWDMLTPTKNKYIYYRIDSSDNNQYLYYVFNESLDTIGEYYGGWRTDVDVRVDEIAKFRGKWFPWLIY